MSIEIHCDHCGKLIKAPDDAGGRRGKCPYCHQSVYVPAPVTEADEEIGIAPIDEEAERHAEELRRESVSYAASVDRDQGALGAAAGGAAAAGGRKATPAQPPGEVVDIHKEVEQFVLAMRDSKLDRADQIVERLKRTGKRAKDHVEGMMLDEMPLNVPNVPAPLLSGFLKTLAARLA